jgi:DeoR/GlpR family transcriptional regulator of sugar metabolism
VKPGDVLMIDAGSTTAFFAQALARKPFEITAITNSLTVAQALGVAETITVLLCPGEFRFTEEGVFGAEVISFLDRYHADLAVIGAGGVAGDEVTDADLQGAAVKRKMMARAQRTMLLADHGKFGQRHFATVCNAGAIDILVTDQALPQGTAQIWREVRVAGSRDEDVAA